MVVTYTFEFLDDVLNILANYNFEILNKIWLDRSIAKEEIEKIIWPEKASPENHQE
jgi:hypothetical protein